MSLGSSVPISGLASETTPLVPLSPSGSEAGPAVGPRAKTAPNVVLATSWAPPDVRDPDGYLDALQRLGAEAVVVVASDAIPADLPSLQRSLGRRRHELAVAALEGQIGALHLGTPQAFQTRLCAIDRAEAETAVAVVRSALDLAGQLGAKAVLISLGSIGERSDGIERLWARLLGCFRRGVLLYDPSSAQELREIRAALASRHLDATMRSLDPLLEEASRRGITLCLRNPPRGIELPAAFELATLRSVFAGAPLSSLLDLPSAHLSSMLQLLPLRDTVLAFAGPQSHDGKTDPTTPPWANLADACGLIAGLVPGQGEARPAAVARALPTLAQRIFAPWALLSPDEVQKGMTAVAAL